MFSHLRRPRKWATACLLAGLWCAAGRAGLAQEAQPPQVPYSPGGAGLLLPPPPPGLPSDLPLPGEDAAAAGTPPLVAPPDGGLPSPAAQAPLGMTGPTFSGSVSGPGGAMGSAGIAGSATTAREGTTCAPSTGGPAGDGKDGADKPKFWWSSVPPYTVLPRPGNFLVPPSGPGYYSLLDWLTGNERQAPPKYPYPRIGPNFYSFFDYDWRYLDDPNNTEHDFFDPLKRILLFNDNVLFTTGGEVRVRYNNEVNSRLSGVNNVYELLRTRVYGDLMIGDRLRIFAEYLDAQSYNQDLPPLPTDVDHSDFLNLFLDLRLFSLYEKPVWFRFGRQELLFESQRLVSPLDWANTRRTFQGGKLFYRSDKLDVDVFCVQPVIPSPGHFDSVDNNQIFSGINMAYRLSKTQTIDAWYYNLDNSAQIFRGQFGNLGPMNVSNVGGRYNGIAGNFLYDLWGSLEFGGYSNQSLFARAFTAGVGYDFKDLPMTPQFWVYYDYASGDPDPGNTNLHQTFDQLFPFGHYYFGFIDVVGRRNINDIMTQVAFYPTPWITTLLQYHMFYLNDAKDALYAANGAAIRQDPTGRSGVTVGQELDWVINFHLTNHQDIFVNYSHLYAGDFIRNTAKTPAQARSPDYFYLQYSFKW